MCTLYKMHTTYSTHYIYTCKLCTKYIIYYVQNTLYIMYKIHYIERLADVAEAWQPSSHISNGNHGNSVTSNIMISIGTVR